MVEATAALRTRAASAGLGSAAIDDMALRFSEILATLVDSGRKLKDQGSRMDLTREIAGAGYVISLQFAAGHRAGLLHRLTKLLRGH